MLTLYRMRIIQATQKFTLAVVSMGFAIMMIYLFNFILGFMGTSVPFLSNRPIGIGISLIFTGVAALFLILDFAVIENGVRYGAPKNMEWYAALGLLITLVWLFYIEMLKLIRRSILVIKMTRTLTVCDLSDWRAGGERRSDSSIRLVMLCKT